MFDRDLTESEREIKNSPERRNEKAFKIVCAAICISLAGGFIYYEMNPEKFNKVSEEKININDSKEFIDNYTLSDKENEELSNNVIADNKNVLEKSTEGIKQMLSDAKDAINDTIDTINNKNVNKPKTLEEIEASGDINALEQRMADVHAGKTDVNGNTNIRYPTDEELEAILRNKTIQINGGGGW